MGGGLEADLSQGAVPALWEVLLGAPPAPSAVDGLRPVLQVADVKVNHEPSGSGGPRPAQYQHYRYSLRLSDGVYSQFATLDNALNHLVASDDLRRGSVVRLLGYSYVRTIVSTNKLFRTILINKLEILQTECALIQSLEHLGTLGNADTASQYCYLIGRVVWLRHFMYRCMFVILQLPRTLCISMFIQSLHVNLLYLK